MHASDLITDDIPPVRPADTVARALDWMEEFKVGHLPVVQDGRLVAVVSDAELAERSGAKATVELAMNRVEVPYVRDRQHIYDVMKLFVERGLSVLPVLDMDGRYLGAISEHEALKRLAEVTNVREPGSVIVLEMNTNDYSLQEIARIVEGNGARVLSVYCHTLAESTRMEVTLKIDREDVSDVLQTFERFKYQVNTTFQGSRFHEDLRGRFDELMRMIDQ